MQLKTVHSWNIQMRTDENYFCRCTCVCGATRMSHVSQSSSNCKGPFRAMGFCNEHKLESVCCPRTQKCERLEEGIVLPLWRTIQLSLQFLSKPNLWHSNVGHKWPTFAVQTLSDFVFQVWVFFFSSSWILNLLFFLVSYFLRVSSRQLLLGSGGLMVLTCLLNAE